MEFFTISEFTYMRKNCLKNVILSDVVVVIASDDPEWCEGNIVNVRGVRKIVWPHKLKQRSVFYIYNHLNKTKLKKTPQFKFSLLLL